MRGGVGPPGLAKLAGVGLAGMALAGCAGPQSALDPRGPDAAAIAGMGWMFFVGAAVIWTGVMLLVAAGMVWPGRFRALDHRRLLVGGGFVFPAVTLVVLTIHTTVVGSRLTGLPAQGSAPLRVQVTGWMFWWEVTYPDTPHGPVATANELHLPVGRPVLVELRAGDVIHSFWVPSLHGKRDLIPGRVNRIVLRADEPGLLRGQCAEFCGTQHALMAFPVVVHAPEVFEAWLADQARPVPPPSTPGAARGAAAFLEAGCGACHVVRGLARGPVAAAGKLGPDLTHVGSRLTLAAGALPNGVGPLAAWIADAQHLKPGNRMPSFDRLDPDTLTAIAGWLDGLK